MANKRRTKQEKIRSAARRSQAPMFTASTTSTQPTFTINTAPISTNIRSDVLRAPVNSHAYVAPEIRKTLFITTTLVALDLALYFLLKLKFVTIPGIGF